MLTIISVGGFGGVITQPSGVRPELKLRAESQSTLKRTHLAKAVCFESALSRL
jgi:hypothetical protein